MVGLPGQVHLARPVVTVAATAAVADGAALEIVEDQRAGRGRVSLDAHREADLGEVDRRGEGGVREPHPAPLVMGADPHAAVVAAEDVLGGREVGRLEDFGHLAASGRRVWLGSTPNRCW